MLPKYGSKIINEMKNLNFNTFFTRHFFEYKVSLAKQNSM